MGCGARLGGSIWCWIPGDRQDGRAVRLYLQPPLNPFVWCGLEHAIYSTMVRSYCEQCSRFLAELYDLTPALSSQEATG